MKFLTKINRNYFFLLTLILLAVSISGYFIIQAIILNDAKESLLEREFLIKKHILKTGEIPNIYPTVEVKIIDRRVTDKPQFKEVEIENELEKELEPFLEYSSQVKIGDWYYSIKLRQSSFERADLALILALFLFILLLSAFAISYLITGKMNKSIWAQFEHNLGEIEKFSFHEKQKLNLIKTDIEEFDRLDKVVTDLTEKLRSDYFSLKEFTENASHEIQTPLSIVLLNLEEVLQQDLNSETFQKVVSSINAIKRLSSLNQSLILLTKIENRQFKAEQVIILNDIVRRKISEFEPFFETKKLNVELHSEQDFKMIINEQLAELLIGNLLTNAVNHNIQGGRIHISIQENKLEIYNTGEENSLTDNTIFNRFAKSNSKSFGLGLAIVKNICETYNLEIHYHKNDFHCFIITSKQEE